MSGSLQSRGISTTQVLPLSIILRPIPPVIEQLKIDSMVQTLQGDVPTANDTSCGYTPGHLPPVDILHYRSPEAKDFYFAFGGCHRLQAYEKARVEGVECKVLKVTKGMLKVYLGGSVDAIVGEDT
ncbi:hypothetical protein Q9L58_010586 [Maublancomyces gigas]|uniref:Sulfiredoxin n=1 Tax=Discina gigas TaxID=1032678 RepID=A0ABR3G455_9PEZI